MRKNPKRPLEEESTTSKEWPPVWSVSFSDLTTLLMTSFILWYALTSLNIPYELLTLKGTRKITAKDIQLLKEMELSPTKEISEITSELKKLLPEQKEAIKVAQKTKRLAEEISEVIRKIGLEKEINILVDIDKVMISTAIPLLFEEGKVKLKRDAYFLLDKIIELIKDLSVQIIIEGHTDTKPIGFYQQEIYPTNWELSSARAINVAEYFIKKGVSAKNIGVSGYAWIKSIAPNDTEENRAKNRRVDIYIILTSEEYAER
ncbi:MAG: flagellar motor protein MotB [Candidatus Omnitrophica bacterium]|nr:flagellar motor protein MotB [Candidatus Omnitrophota bacterium]